MKSGIFRLMRFMRNFVTVIPEVTNIVIAVICLAISVQMAGSAATTALSTASKTPSQRSQTTNGSAAFGSGKSLAATSLTANAASGVQTPSPTNQQIGQTSSDKVSASTTQKPHYTGTPLGPLPVTVYGPNELTLSTYSVTMSDFAHATLNPTVTVTAGGMEFEMPTVTGNTKTYALNSLGLGPSPQILRISWTFTIMRDSAAVYGADTMVFTSPLTTGKTVSAQMSLYLEPINTFTATKGAMDETKNADGSYTFTAHVLITPGPTFNNVSFNVCELQYAIYTNPCVPSTEEVVPYTGSNDITVSQTVPTLPYEYQEGFDMAVLISGTVQSNTADDYTLTWTGIAYEQ